MLTLRRILSITAVFVLPAWAQAHPGHDGHELTWDFQGGFAHPFSGWDHIVAMVALGLWSTQLRGRAWWSVPAAFAAMLVVGASLGRVGLSPAAIGGGLAVSLMILGVLVAMAARMPVIAGATMAGLFALLQGLVHGAQLPATSPAFGYSLGWITASAFLAMTALAAGRAMSRSALVLPRYAGSAIAVTGLLLFIA